MVYPGSVLMTDMFFCMFCLPKEHLECFTNLNIAQICCMLQKSQKWYILDQHWWLVCFPPLCRCFFFCLKGIQIYFFLGSRMFVICINLNIAKICYMIENSQKWYILHQHWWLVCFLVFCVFFVCSIGIHICFFHIKMLLQKLHFTRIFQLW